MLNFGISWWSTQDRLYSAFIVQTAIMSSWVEKKNNMGQQIGCKMATNPLPLAVTSCDNKQLICAILMVSTGERVWMHPKEITERFCWCSSSVYWGDMHSWSLRVRAYIHLNLEGNSLLHFTQYVGHSRHHTYQLASKLEHLVVGDTQYLMS